MTTSAPLAAKPPVEASDELLRRNLAALGRSSPGVAALVERTPPRPDVVFERTEQNGALTASVDGRWLASRRRPLDEAERLADTVKVKESAGVVVTGFGVGHHVAEIARRVGRMGLVLVFEPDVPLLRAVLERMDISEWVGSSNIVVLTDAEDAAAISQAVQGVETLLALGTKIVAHAPSAARLGESAGAFGRTLARIVSTVRTNVVTTMMQTPATVRNVLMNLDHYVTRPGVADLENFYAGRPAVVVAAGPSLARNVRLLAALGVRERCAIIAVQTTLKPLLAAGIKPHFVTALDYHEISARFYEGLTPEMVEGVTLIAEPKANPMILDAFPGAIRCPRDEFLDITLGPEISPAPRHGSIRQGSTVAHLAYYLARHLGCDPVALIGQDLGFTDGQYYAAGAAIHNVWACELNPFRTLEMFEWERIARARTILRPTEDHLGRHVYSDEQMMTYLAQFERDFKADEAMGLMTIDATEGGVRKAHTERMRLGAFLERFASQDAPTLPPVPCATRAEAAKADLARARRRLREVRAGVWRLGELSRKAERLLDEMLETPDDADRVNPLVQRVHAVRDEAFALQPAYELTQRFNQAGAFGRARADRAIHLRDDQESMATNRVRMDRDKRNLRWLAESADELGGTLDGAVRAIEGGPKATRDVIEPDALDAGMRAGDAERAEATVAALIPLWAGAPGASHGLSLKPIASGPLAGRVPLRETLARLSRSRLIRRAIIVTDDERAVRAAVGAHVDRVDVIVETAPPDEFAGRFETIRASRAFAPDCWRGAAAGFTIYDELIAPRAMADAMRRHGVEGALLVGPGWMAVDHALADEVVERFRERPDKHKVVFTQAAPGLAPALLHRELLDDLAGMSEPGKAGVFASTTGLLGYVPVRPMADPIALPICVRVGTAARDVRARLIWDSAAGRNALERAARALAPGLHNADADAIARAADTPGAERFERCASPRHLIVEVCAERALGGRRLAWAWGDAAETDRPRPPRPRMRVDDLARLAREVASGADDAVITLAGAGDPLLHPDLPALIRAARDAGVASVHVRTDFVATESAIDALLASAVGVVSVDLLAERVETYAALTGGASFAPTLEALCRALERRSGAGTRWLPTPMIVPRITRCDAVYEEIEQFYDRWTMVAGAAMIDPMPRTAPTDLEERIAPMPKPRTAALRDAAERMLVLSDGTVLADERDLRAERPVGNALHGSVAQSWAALMRLRAQAFGERGADADELRTGQ